MEEKYYIDIDSSRKILGRYLQSFHSKIPSTAQEVSKEVFETSIQENHNYLNENLITEIRDLRTPEQLAEEERLSKLPTQEDILNAKIELKALELLSQLELI